jgi:hypothetical protein
MNERRNPHRRAEMQRRIVSWLVSQSAPVRRIPDEIADSAAAARILAKFAIRGLVRCLSEGWVASPVLRTPSISIVND